MIVITGANGQDGQILTTLLASMGRDVTALVSSGSKPKFVNWWGNNVQVLESLAQDRLGLDRFSSNHIEVVIHLAAASSVASSIANPLFSMQRNTLLSMEAIEFAVVSGAPLLFASSSEVYPRVTGSVSELSTHQPHTAYGFSKSMASKLLQFYRSKELLMGSVITMFNHESPLRGGGFLTKSIANQVLSAKKSMGATLELNSPSSAKDFSWTPEFIAMLAHPKLWNSNSDFVLGSGKLTSAAALASEALEHARVSLAIVETGSKRENDVHPVADSKKAWERFGWKVDLLGPRFMRNYLDIEIEALSIPEDRRQSFVAGILAQDASEKLRSLY